MGDIEMQPLVEVKSKRWPRMFWFLLRILGLFYHRSVVLERKCFSCSVIQESRSCKEGQFHGVNTELDFYISAYEADSPVNYEHKKKTAQGENECAVCQSLWWNCNGNPYKYTERDIGLSGIFQRWNGVISVGWLVTALIILQYDLISFSSRLFGRPKDILNFLIMLSFYVLLSVHYVFAMCSKLHSIFKSTVSKLSWATALNARYLVKRAQFLDLENRGLPGKSFLVFCVCSTFILATYRMFIFLFISDCDVTVYSISQSVTGIFMVNCGLSIYCIFFIRVSFQSQLKLLLAYIKDFKGDFGECKAIIFEVVADFACFKRLCQMYVSVNFPAVVLAAVANLTIEYINSANQCLLNDETAQRISMHLAVLAWSEITFALLSYAIAMGGYNVRYLWQGFVLNALLVKANHSTLIRQVLVKESEVLLRESRMLLATIIFSITGIYIGFQFGDQNGAILDSSCNATSEYSRCT